MTVKEYLAAPWWKKVSYRIFRSPLIMFTIGPFLDFSLVQRIPGSIGGKRERASVWWTDLALVVLIGLLIFLVGWRTYLLVQLPVLCWAHRRASGCSTFSITSTQPTGSAIINGNSSKPGLKAVRTINCRAVLQWFTGNIGFHHIHHLSPKIPNYKLPKAYKENPVFHVRPMTILASLSSLRMRLYDEEKGMMVGWDGLKRYLAKTFVGLKIKFPPAGSVK